ncbi:hypothetical protein Cni_G06578 [Canna indica]|uniref:Uncharacterized protein n=1 Tax=Canna indica TaxID=4628 RepID=A0AAQ3Q635_9LILI|nr:hypothetical protein Cni_G06578 [Canna indica]
MGDREANIRGKFLVNWDTLMGNLEKGDLGQLNLHSHNQARFGGWLWELCQNKEKQWVDILKAIFIDFDHLYARCGRLSPVWRGIIRGVDFFNSSLSFQVGEGRSTCLWTDPWLNGSKLTNIFHDIFPFVTNPSTSIANAKEIDIDGSVRGWNIQIENQIPLVREEGELSPNGDFEEDNFVAFEDSSINISPRGKDNSSSRVCRVRFGQIESSHGETAGENDDDECEESAHLSMDSPDASEAVEDASVSESTDGDE